MSVSYETNEHQEEAGEHRSGTKDRDGTLAKIRRCVLVRNMAKNKRKLKKFTAGTEARRRAREVAGPPPAERVIPDKRRKPGKHKPDMLQELD